MVVPPHHRIPLFATSAPHQPSAHHTPFISTKHPGFLPSHPIPVFPDPHTPDIPHVAHSPPSPTTQIPLANTSEALRPTVTSTSPVLQTSVSSTTPTTLPPPTTTSKTPGIPRFPDSKTPRPSHSPSHQTSLTSPPDPHTKVQPVLREGVSESPLLTSATPTDPGEASLASRSRRDDRWLLVALLVPTCVFLVFLLALGIVYCTRCGPHAPNKRVTDCYRWVTQAGSKGPTAPVPPGSSHHSGVQTCRTSV